MPRGVRYSEEELAAIAAKYDSLKEFRVKEPNVYRTICYHGLAEKLCGHMERKDVKYTDEDLAEIAARYDNPKTFKKEQPSALVTIRNRGLYEKLCGHMKYIRKPKYSDKELIDTVANYDNIKEFVKKERGVYHAICDRGLLDKLCGHMKRLNQNKRVANEELAAIASKYDDLRLFREKEVQAYRHICERGLHHLCDHMKRGVIYHSEEELAEVAARYNVMAEFRKENPKVYDMIRSRGLLEKLCGHMKKCGYGRKIGEVYRAPYTDEELFEITRKYDAIGDFKKKEAGAYGVIRNKGLIDKFCGHMSRKIRHVTDAELEELALQYDNMKDFRTEQPRAFDRMCKRGLVEKFCEHMKREVNRYTEEELAAAAAKYDNFNDFFQSEPWAYKSIRNRGLLDKLCGHFKRSGSLVRRKIYVFTFSDGYAYVGLSLNPNKRFLQHTKHGTRPTAVYRHIQESKAEYKFAILTDWLNVDAASKMEDYYIKQYTAEGWKMLNKSRAGGLGSGMKKIYSDKFIKSEVSKYEYLRDFRKGSPRLYGYLKRNNLIEKHCSQLKRLDKK